MKTSKQIFSALLFGVLTLGCAHNQVHASDSLEGAFRALLPALHSIRDSLLEQTALIRTFLAQNTSGVQQMQNVEDIQNQRIVAVPVIPDLSIETPTSDDEYEISTLASTVPGRSSWESVLAPSVVESSGAPELSNVSSSRRRGPKPKGSAVCLHEGCGLSFKGKEKLSRHQSLHDQNRPYVCDTCGLRFTTTSHLSRHKNTNGHGISQDVESISNTGSRNKRQRADSTEELQVNQDEVELNNDNDEIPALSSTVPGRSSDETTVENIVETHPQVRRYKSRHAGAPVICPEEGCGRSFRFGSLYNQHKGVHDQSRHFVCNTCGYRYTTGAVLSRHMNASGHGIFQGVDSISNTESSNKRQRADSAEELQVNQDEFELNDDNEELQVNQDEFELNDDNDEIPALSSTVPDRSTSGVQDDVQCNNSGAMNNLQNAHDEITEAQAREKIQRFVCQQERCNFSTKLACTLREHLRSVHNPSRPVVCEQCSYRFLTNQAMKRHMTLNHGSTENEDDRTFEFRF